MSQVPPMPLHPRKILLPFDFSTSSEEALATATDFARHFQSQLVLLNIVPMIPMLSADEYSSFYFPQQELLETARKKAADHLATCVQQLAEIGVHSTAVVEIGNDVVGNIMMVIEREQIDLIIISTHGLSGWRPAVFGSIAEKVIRLVECPILLLRTKKAV